jgi:hypothetical protein
LLRTQHVPGSEATSLLHDRAEAGMSALALELGLISLDADPGLGVQAAQDMLSQAINDLRGIGTTLLVSAQLGPALRALADRCHLRLRLDLPRRDLGAELRSRIGLLVANHLNTLRAGSSVLVRVRGRRRSVRVNITDQQPGQPGPSHYRAVLTCA